MSNMYIFEDLLENKIHRFCYSPLEKTEELSENERIDALENQNAFREHLYKELKGARTKVEKEIIQKQMDEINVKIRDLLISFHREEKNGD